MRNINVWDNLILKPVKYVSKLLCIKATKPQRWNPKMVWTFTKNSRMLYVKV